MFITEGGPSPSDEELLEMLKETMREMIQSLKALERDCGEGPIGLLAKERIKQKITTYRKLLYGAIYGHQPPFDLPDNWESASS
jgi:hypothetical protein